MPAVVSVVVEQFSLEMIRHQQTVGFSPSDGWSAVDLLCPRELSPRNLFGTDGSRKFGTKAKRYNVIMPHQTRNYERTHEIDKYESIIMFSWFTETKHTTLSYVHTTSNLTKFKNQDIPKTKWENLQTVNHQKQLGVVIMLVYLL